jgi:hypothetical protein
LRLSKLLRTYVVEGGIGKCVAFSALVPALAKKAGEGIQIYTPYIDVFANNPDVAMAFESSLPLHDPRILASDSIEYCEPYKSTFIKGGQHIIESFCDLLGVEYDPAMRPKLYTEHLVERAAAWLEEAEVSGPYMMVQFSGGQSPIGYSGAAYQSVNAGRNYPPFLAQQVVVMLREQYPDMTIIDCTLPNEPGYEGTVKWGEHWAVLHEALKGAQGFVGIDSSLQHLAASAGQCGAVVWGNTRWSQFGYGENVNVQYHMGDEWDEQRYDADDPRNVMVEPAAVVDAYAKRRA